MEATYGSSLVKLLMKTCKLLFTFMEALVYVLESD